MRSTTFSCYALGLTSRLTPCVPTRDLLNLCGRWGCRSSNGCLSAVPYPVERRRPRHPHPEASQSRVREAAVAAWRSSNQSCLEILNYRYQAITLIDLEFSSRVKDGYACMFLKGRHHNVGRDGEI